MTDTHHPPGVPPAPLYARMLRIALLSIAWGVGAFAFIVLFTLVFAAFTGALRWLLPFAAILLLALLANIARGRRRRRGAMVLAYVEQCVRLNLPPVPLLRAAAAGESARTARRLEDMASAVAQGLSPGQGLSLTTPEIPARSLGLIAAAERIGQLPSMLHRLVREDRAAVRRIDPTRTFYRWYPLLLLLALTTLVSLLGLSVMPRFEMIFRDFGYPLPWLTVIVFRLADSVSPFIVLIVFVIVILAAGRRLWELRRGPQALPGRSVQDVLLWCLPFTRQAVTDRALADVCTLVAEALAVGRPLERALDEAQQLDMNGLVRRRIVAWNAHLHAGALPAAAAAQARLPRFFVGMLGTAQAASNLPEVLVFLGRYYGARFSRTLILLQSAYVPVVVFVMALLVGAVALSLMLPLQRLIDGLAPSYGVF